jgi:hypothetical protein
MPTHHHFDCYQSILKTKASKVKNMISNIRQLVTKPEATWSNYVPTELSSYSTTVRHSKFNKSYLTGVSMLTVNREWYVPIDKKNVHKIIYRSVFTGIL